MNRGLSRQRKIFWTGLAGFLLVLLSLSPLSCGTKKPPSPAPSISGITLISSQVKTHFPKKISFHLKAKSKAKISKVELEYKLKKLSPAEVIVAVFPDFTPAKKVETSWKWDMRKASLPPGAKVKYRWKLQDRAGNELTTDFRGFRFVDQRYKWHKLKGGKVSLLWHERDKSFAQELMRAVQGTLRKLAEDTGAELKRPVKIWVYASASELRKAMIFPQEWTGGVAFARFGTIAIGISPFNLTWGKRALAHELTHLVNHQMTFNPYNELPTWLDEGLAMHSEGELRRDLKKALEQAIFQNRLFSARSLCSSFPAGAKEAKVCYAQSYSLVEFLLKNFGREKMLKLLQNFKKGVGYDEVLLHVYGFDLDGLDQRWRKSL